MKVNSLALPKGTVLEKGTEINFRNTLGRRSVGVIADIKPHTGEFGWIRVTNAHISEWVSVRNQIDEFGEEGILLKAAAAPVTKEEVAAVMPTVAEDFVFPDGLDAVKPPVVATSAPEDEIEGF